MARLKIKKSEVCLRQGTNRVLPLPTTIPPGWGDCRTCNYDSNNVRCAGYVSKERDRDQKYLAQVYARPHDLRAFQQANP